VLPGRPGDAANITAKVLVCIGADDPYITPEHRAAFEAEMTAAGVDWRMHLYGGIKHSFTHPRADVSGIPGLAYHPASAERAWSEMLTLFDETLSPTPSSTPAD
jgi:dienelactone hydrolase